MYFSQVIDKKNNFSTDILSKAWDGDDVAQLLLGNIYFRAVYTDNNCFQAFEWFSRSAKQGNAEAQFRLADLYALGQGVEQSHEAAFEWYTKAALQGYKKALIRIHNLYHGDQKMHCRGQLNSEEEEWASDTFKKENHIRELNEYRLEQHQSKLNHAIDYYNQCFNELNSSYLLDQYDKTKIAFLFEHGYGGKKSVLRAIVLYKDAAEQGHTDAQYHLANVYHQNENIKFHYRHALRWYRAAAVNGNVVAQNCLADFYEKGFTTEVYLEGAIYWYTKAATAGNSNAQLNLGRLYRKGQGVSQSFTEAAKWYRLAANQGNKAALNCLNQLIKRGKITISDDTENTTPLSIDSLSTYTLCSKLQNDISKLDAFFDIKELKKLEQHALMTDGNAMYQIGLKYHNGDKLPHDEGTGFQWMKRAAKAGIQEATLKLAEMYKNGDTVEQDYHESSIWTMKLAKKRNHDAQYSLGLLYKNGLGVRKDALEASKWFIKSADQGNTEAQYQFALLKLNGDGVRQDRDEAFKLFYDLALQGNLNSLCCLGTMYLDGDLSQSNEGLIIALFQHDGSVKTKEKRFLRMIKAAARHGHIESQFKLGEIYEKGELILEDLTKALEYYTLAANSGDSHSQKQLFLKYLDRTFKDPLYTKSIDLLQKILEKETTVTAFIQAMESICENVNLKFNLLLMFFSVLQKRVKRLEYFIGCFCESYHKISSYSIEPLLKYLIELYSDVVDSDDARAQCRLGNIYREDFELKDLYKAYCYYSQAYENGSIEAAYHLGLMYLNGDGVSSDLMKAFQLFTEASNVGYKRACEMIEPSNDRGNLEMLETVANLGYVAIQYHLGVFYENNDDEKSFQWLTLAADGGISDAYYRLGRFYETGRYTYPNYNKAISLYQKAAQKDHTDALFKLAQIYHYGKYTKQDYVEAYNFYKRAASLKHIESFHFLNALKASDNNSKISSGQVDDSICMLKNMAEQGDVDVQYELGNYYKNDSDNKNYVEAFKWYQMASDNNHTEATYELGLLYQRGLGIDQDYVKSLELYQQAGIQGSHNAIFRSGIAYQHGYGVSKNCENAVKNYTRAAEMGNAESQYKLGTIYESGEIEQKDILKALKWYTKAYLNNNDDAAKSLYNMYDHELYESFFYEKLFQILLTFDKAFEMRSPGYEEIYGTLHYKLGTMYLDGIGITKNDIEALNQFRKAYYDYSNHDAEEYIIPAHATFYDDSKNKYLQMLDAYYTMKENISADEQYNLGMLYYTGIKGVSIEDNIKGSNSENLDPTCKTPIILLQKDYSLASQYLELASQNNYTKAQEKLGFMYLQGMGVQQDDNIALKWFRKATDKAKPSFCYDQGMKFYKGDGVEKNDTVAFLYLKRAAETNNAEAQACLGEMYLQGEGVSKNTDEAMKWIKKAAANMTAEQCYKHGMKLCKSKNMDKDLGIAFVYLRKAAENNIGSMPAHIDETDHSNDDHKNLIDSIYKKMKQTAEILYRQAYHDQAHKYFIEDPRIQLKSETIKRQKDIEENDDDIQRLLGEIHLQDDDIEKNKKEAMQSIKQAAINMSGKECYWKGWTYYEGFNVDKNMEIAFVYLQKGAEKNDYNAQRLLGDMYLQGDGVEKNKDEAMKWIDKAAENMSGDECYEQGVNFYSSHGVDKNLDIALLYLLKAVEKNNTDAQVYLAELYLRGDYIPNNRDDAIKRVKKVAETMHGKKCHKQ